MESKDFNFTIHIDKQSRDRFGVGIRDFMDKYKGEAEWLKKSTPEYPGLKGTSKVKPHHIFIIYPKQNAGISFDPYDNTCCTILFLDGTDGYTGLTTYDWKLEQLQNKFNGKL